MSDPTAIAAQIKYIIEGATDDIEYAIATRAWPAEHQVILWEALATRAVELAIMAKDGGAPKRKGVAMRRLP
jgi:hypothetical protein